MIGPLLQAFATATAARSLRAAADRVLVRALLAVGAALALVVSAACLSLAAFDFLERQLDPAGAAAIVGALWGTIGIGALIAMRR